MEWTEIPGGGGHRQDFDSVTDLLNTCVDAPATVPEGQRHSRSKGNFSSKFTGADSFEATIELARNGWPEGREYCATFSQVLFDKIASKIFVPQIVFREMGEEVDVATLMTGEPECFLEFEDSDIVVDSKSARSKIVKIVSSVDACGFVSKDQMLRRGAAVCALVDAFEKSGRRCEVVATVASLGYGSGKSKRLQNAVTLKYADQPLQFDILAFMLCHASVLRRLFFGLWETVPAHIRALYGMGNAEYMGYGAPAEADVPGDIVLSQASYVDSCWDSEASTIKWILTELKKQGVQLID